MGLMVWRVLHRTVNKLTWTSNRNAKKDSQIFLANWTQEAALQGDFHQLSLGLRRVEEAEACPNWHQCRQTGQRRLSTSVTSCVGGHVDYLCRKELGGRMTGSKVQGTKSHRLRRGLPGPPGLDASGRQRNVVPVIRFPGREPNWVNKTSEPEGRGTIPRSSFEVDEDWRPLTFSGNALAIDATDVVFAGYGIVAPKQGDNDPAYDSYEDLDAKDKWVDGFSVCSRKRDARERDSFNSSCRLRKKISCPSEGAIGMIVVSGPNSQVRKQLVPMQNDISPSGSSLAAISVTDATANRLLESVGKRIENGSGRTGRRSNGARF